MEDKSDVTYVLRINGKIYKYICRYSIIKNGKYIENGIVGWKTAIAHARKHVQDLFETKKPIIEILNLWTGEIVTLEEAERRTKKAQLAEPRRP